MKTVEKAGILAIASKLQYILDEFRDAGNLFYKTHEMNFETKWFPPIYVLSVVDHLSVTELAREIALSHPSAISLFKEIEKNGLITSVKDPRDERKRNLMLTTKGRETVTALKPYWEVISRTLSEITSNAHNLYLALSEVEGRLEEKPLVDRLNEKAAHIFKLAEEKSVSIVKCEDHLRLDLARAIEKNSFPGQNNKFSSQKAIYFLASVNGLPAGYARVLATSEKKVEVENIAVLEQYRNTGVSSKIVKYLAQYFSQKEFLELTCDIEQKGLFEHLGFVIAKDVNRKKANNQVRMLRNTN